MVKHPRKFYQSRHFYNDKNEKINERESYVLMFEHGSVEGWRAPSGLDHASHYGGIEVHSAHPMYEGHEPMPGHCQYVQGGTCYHDGSSLAFDQIEYYFDSPAAIYGVLAGWESNLERGMFGAMLNMLAEGADET